MSRPPGLGRGCIGRREDGDLAGAFGRWGDFRGLVAVPRRRWRSDKAAHRTHRSTDRGTEGRTMSTGSRSPDRSPATCADEAATDCPLNGIIRVGAGRQR
jgi:hypothetical protein